MKFKERVDTFVASLLNMSSACMCGWGRGQGRTQTKDFGPWEVETIHLAEKLLRRAGVLSHGRGRS